MSSFPPGFCVLGLDPGPDMSALVSWNGSYVVDKMYTSNDELLHHLRGCVPNWPLVIEKIASYGMAVGESTFETVYWSGRFHQAYFERHQAVQRLTRADVKLHLCHSMQAKDSNVRQALIDRFGPPGKKDDPGALYGIKSHLWAALAVSVTWYDQNKEKGIAA